MPAEVTIKINTIVSDYIAPALKKQEFRKSGQRFWKRSSDDELGVSLVAVIEKFAIPWFVKFSSLESAVNYLDREYVGRRNAWFQKVSAMCGQALLGNLDRASALYNAALGDSRNRGEMAIEFADWRKTYGIS